MRRFLSETSGYLVDLAQSARSGWDQFFFKPADPTSLGLMRLMVGTLLTWNIAVLGLDLRDYLGSDGWIGPEAVRQYLAESSPWAWSFWFHVPDQWLPVAWLGCLVVMVLFTVGFASRVTAVLAWTIAVSTVRRAPVTLFGFDQMISTWTFYLAAFGACGQAVSLDRFLVRFRHLRLGKTASPAIPVPTTSANLCLRLIQLHLVLVYGSAGFAKLMGAEWWNGTALEMIILTPEYRRFDLSSLLAYPAALSLATHGGLFLEICYPIMIWVRKLRPVLLASMILMHLGIDLFLGLTEFGLAMIAANLSFFAGHWLRRQLVDTKRPIGTLLVNPLSSKSLGRSAILIASDPDGRIEMEAEKGWLPANIRDDAPRLRLPDGRLIAGRHAFLFVAKRLPWFTPLGLIGRTLGIRSGLNLGKIPELQETSRVGKVVGHGRADTILQVCSNAHPTPGR